MGSLNNIITEEQLEEMQSFVSVRLSELKSQREELDDDISDEIDLYNNEDKYLDQKEEWEEKNKQPYIYTAVQTIVARLIQSLFGEKNYVKFFSEEDTNRFYKIEKRLTRWLQNKVDQIKLRGRARDFLEDSCVERVNWLQLRPEKDKDGFRVDFDIYSFFDVWFDKEARSVEETDMIIRKKVKLHKVLENDKVYFNLDELKENIISTVEDDQEKEEKIAAQNNIAEEEEITSLDVLRDVELYEYYGVYDFSEAKDYSDVRDVLITLANKKVIIRVEEIDYPTKRKKMIFPIRPLRQAKSLLGKGVPQILKDNQYELNEVRSLRMQNLKTLIKLLWKYNANAQIPWEELFAGPGNAVPFYDKKDDIDTFNVPNVVGLATQMIYDITRDMQQTSGAVEHILGQSAKGSETATEVKTLTQQALFKFSMMAENVYDDIVDVIKYLAILHIVYDKDTILSKYSEFADFCNQSIENLENTTYFDIELKDIATRRDIERSQFINAANVILPVMQSTGGNVKEFLREFLKAFKMENIDGIVEPPSEQQQLTNQIIQLMNSSPMIGQFLQMIITNPQMLANLMGAMMTGQGGQGGQGATNHAQNMASPEEEIMSAPEKRTE